MTQQQTSGDMTEKTDGLLELLLQVSRVFFRMRALGQGTGAVSESGAGSWGLMHSLAADGPQTVPQIARARPVSRQHIQLLVNELVDAGLVELIDNPQHKRSRLVSLTAKGRADLQATTARLHEVLDQLGIAASASDISTSNAVLGEIAQAMQEQLAVS